MDKYINYINQNSLGELYYDKTFKEITTLKVGGKVKLLYYPNSTVNFVRFYKYYIKFKDVSIFIIGNGSNVHASDDDYDGIVISFKKIKELVCYDNYIIASSGIMSHSISHLARDNKLSGGEFLAFIPGTIGGVVTMNASSYGCAAEDIVCKCLCIDEYGTIKWYTREELEFGYRKSLIKIKKLILLKVKMRLQKKELEEINEITNKIKMKRINSQPINYNSAGSVFKNTNTFKAWELIDSVGLRGLENNGAMISSLHPNFIINKGSAKAKDIYDLMNIIREKVYKNKNILLECEWVLINFKNEL